jgi:hypothetical protein
MAMDRADATGTGAYADGYRRAALDIATSIRRKASNRSPSKLERDVREAELEARVLAGVARAASTIATESDPDAHPIEALRALLLLFYKLEELPPILRVVPPRSSTRLVEDDADSSIVARRGA